MPLGHERAQKLSAPCCCLLLSTESDDARVTALVADVDSGHAADFAVFLHALAVGFELLSEWLLLFAGCRLGLGLLLLGALFACCLLGFGLLCLWGAGWLLFAGCLQEFGLLEFAILLDGWSTSFFQRKDSAVLSSSKGVLLPVA